MQWYGLPLCRPSLAPWRRGDNVDGNGEEVDEGQQEFTCGQLNNTTLIYNPVSHKKMNIMNITPV
eukprot:5781441-Amphidinium_carterae.1